MENLDPVLELVVAQRYASEQMQKNKILIYIFIDYNMNMVARAIAWIYSSLKSRPFVGKLIHKDFCKLNKINPRKKGSTLKFLNAAQCPDKHIPTEKIQFPS